MKRTLYPKLLGGYLIYGLICFIIISTFGYHITFNFLERRDASTLYRESALISSNYAENYFKRSKHLDPDFAGNENTALHPKHLPFQRNLDHR